MLVDHIGVVESLGIIGAKHWRSDITCISYIYRFILSCGGFDHLYSIEKNISLNGQIGSCSSSKGETTKDVKENHYLQT